MFEQQSNEIKQTAEEFFEKMTITGLTIEVVLEPIKKDDNPEESAKDIKGVIVLKIQLPEPQVLIGQQGQTLFELQRLLRILLNKRLKDNYYLSLDINDYKRSKMEYLESLAQNVADEVSMMKKEKELPPMNSYERRIIHAKLSGRSDILAESYGQGQERRLVIKPK